MKFIGLLELGIAICGIGIDERIMSVCLSPYSLFQDGAVSAVRLRLSLVLGVDNVV